MRLAILLPLALVGAFAALAPAQQSAVSEQRYSMTARSLGVDSCDLPCPCLFGNPPSGGACRFLTIIEIEKGNCGTIKLDGTKWALYGEFSGEPRKKRDWAFHAIYIDARANFDQKDAIKRIVNAPPFTDMGTLAGVIEVPIDVTAGELPLDEWKVKIGEKGSFTATPLRGRDGSKPLVIENAFYPFPAERIALAVAKGEFRDLGKPLHAPVNTGAIGKWTLTGLVPPGTLPAGMKKDK